MISLTIIVATSRPRLASLVLEQYLNQQINITTELIMVCEGFTDCAHRATLPPTVRFISKEIQGAFGAYAKDVGIAAAVGEYVCFWDDDNYYMPHAAATLYAAAHKYDLGIVQIEQCVQGQSGFVLPQTPMQFEVGNVDTMCMCVRRGAITALWADGDAGPGTDIRWLTRLGDLRHNFMPIVIGRKFVTHD